MFSSETPQLGNMAAPRGKKRKSEQSAVSVDDHDAQTAKQVPVTKASEEILEESPRKRRRLGISINQKQALIDNLQLESKIIYNMPHTRVSHAIPSFESRIGIVNSVCVLQSPNGPGSSEPTVTYTPRLYGHASKSASTVFHCRSEKSR